MSPGVLGTSGSGFGDETGDEPFEESESQILHARRGQQEYAETDTRGNSRALNPSHSTRCYIHVGNQVAVWPAKDQR